MSGDLTVVSDIASVESNTAPKFKTTKPRENGGRYGFDDYPDALTTVHDVEGIKIGDECLHCRLGKYYPGEDRKLLEFTGGPMITPKRHIKKTLRCNRCGHEAISTKKIVRWTPEARGALVINKIYGTPWYRMGRIQKLFGVPIAVSTCWGQAKAVWEESAQYVVSELYKEGIESSLFCTDDTGMKILSVLKVNELLPEVEQRACHTTAICALNGKNKIILYITANRYCRENWSALLEKRKSTNKAILMTDASNQSLPKGEELKKVTSAVCLGGHGRKKFKELEKHHPEECTYFLERISELYKNESEFKKESPKERLKFHQKNSGPIIGEIFAKIKRLFHEKLVEPNSDLGKAMQYWLNHKKGLTAFLRIAGAPLDNNLAENALRIMAIYRNGSLFFKTLESAMIMSDMFSLVVTCESNGINAFAYLNWIQVHWKQVQAEPHLFMPWHFKNETEKIVA